MLYSQNTVFDLSKTWKMMIAAFSVIFVWQYLQSPTGLSSSAHAQEIPASVATISHTMSGPNVEQNNITREAAAPRESFAERWRNANFLDIVDTPETLRHNQDDLFCLAKNIYHEAGNQSRLGKFAVAQVTINRMKNPLWRDTICGVVFEPYQFSWANNRSLRWSTPRSSEMWRESREIAREALVQGFRVKGMEDAVYYHATYVNPGWRNVERLVRIGAHIFYERA